MSDTYEANIEKKPDETVPESCHTLSFDEKVIKKIVGYATTDIPGILAMSGNFISGLTDMLRSSDDPTKGIAVELNNEKATISMKVICEYGRNMPSIFQEIVDKVSKSVNDMTGYDVASIKVHVYDVLTKEDFERQGRKKQEEKQEPAAEDAGSSDAEAQ